MQDERFFYYSATAQLVIDPIEDRVLFVNQEACRLLHRDVIEIQSGRASQLFAPNLPALILFTQELIEKGRGWCDHLLVQSAIGETRLEVNGRCSDSGGQPQLFLGLRPLEQGIPGVPGV